MSLFDRFRRRPPKETPLTAASKRNVEELEEFLTSRTGIEAYVEPPTTTYAMTLCLVAGDGESLRRAIKDEKRARKLCDEHGVPLYDARIVGYPQRMKDYQRGVRREAVNLEDLPPLDTTPEHGSGGGPEHGSGGGPEHGSGGGPEHGSGGDGGTDDHQRDD